MKNWKFAEKTPASGLVFNHKLTDAILIVYPHKIRRFTNVVDPAREDRRFACFAKRRVERRGNYHQFYHKLYRREFSR
jgi:hypothetical protein